jgi:hypothetical protein
VVLQKRSANALSDARELLAKLTPHGIPFDAVSFGGIPELSSTDVAAGIAMAHLCIGEAALLRVRYCGDQSSWTEARIAWYSRVHSIGIEDRWPKPSSRHPTWLVMALGSLVEHCGSGRCHVCHGVAHLLINNLVATCAACRGSGREPIGERRLSELAAIPRTTWRRTYSVLMEVCRREIETIDSRACAAVAAKLRG